MARALATITNVLTHPDCVTIRAISAETIERKPGYITRHTDGDAISSCIELQLCNNTKTDITLECTLLTKQSYFQLDETNAATIAPSEKGNVTVRPKEEGEVQTTALEITVVKANGETEKIIRYLKFGGSDDTDETEDTKQRFNKVHQYKPYFPFDHCELGKRPDTPYRNNLKMEWPLHGRDVPNGLRNAINRGVFSFPSEYHTENEKRLRHDLFDSLTMSNYKKRFAMLLHMEKCQSEKDIKQYDMRNASLVRSGDLLYLEVPGLAENRPSVIVGDIVHVRPLTSLGRLEEFPGDVHCVERGWVGLRFSHSLWAKYRTYQKYYVRFSLNPLTLWLMHRSSENIVLREDASQILFPLVPAAKDNGNKTGSSVTLVNTLIEENLEQKKAIEMIVSGDTAKVFIIYGPPGSGKTITLVEAILQLLRSGTAGHILVCAPSNSACDLMTTRLLKHVDKTKVFRMHAPSRSWNDIPEDVRRASNYNNGAFYFPPKEILMQYPIVVSTLFTTGRVASAKFPEYHFTHVFIDEAGQASEPEIMIALAGVMAEDGKLVMAGDPKQLGPVVRSSLARTNGLQISFLERLMNTSKVHKKVNGHYDPTAVVQLLKNYRSHESIIEIPNKLFYDNELQVSADRSMRYSMTQWEHLPKRGFPLIFHGVQGDDRQELHSPSYFNLEEAKLVKMYVKYLLSSHVEAEQIGVISPYRLQVTKIRQDLEAEIKVGCVEEFQGQERLAIIISTVRSNNKFRPHDVKFDLGFLRNPKRFDVAITRAKALLIIIGNPRILCFDKYWRSILEYCIDNGGYTGIRFDIRDERYRLKNVEKSLEKLALDGGNAGSEIRQMNSE